MVNPSPTFQKTLDWLDAGAPHVIFDMKVSVMPTERARTMNYISQEKLNEKPECGTACCIAGYIVQSEHPWVVRNNHNWDFVQEEALALLNLPERENTDTNLPIFDPDFAPTDATPADAARAMRNWAEADFTYDPMFNPWR